MQCFQVRLGPRFRQFPALQQVVSFLGRLEYHEIVRHLTGLSHMKGSSPRLLPVVVASLVEYSYSAPTVAPDWVRHLQTSLLAILVMTVGTLRIASKASATEVSSSPL